MKLIHFWVTLIGLIVGDMKAVSYSSNIAWLGGVGLGLTGKKGRTWGVVHGWLLGRDAWVILCSSVLTNFTVMEGML